MKIPALIFCIFIFRCGVCQSGQAHASTTNFKILSWNIYMLPGLVPSKKKRQRSVAIGKLLAQSNYDVIVFQEAFCKSSRKCLSRLLGDAYPYQAGPANANGFSLRANSGVWIFSKHPILFTDAIIFRTRFGVDALSRKGALLSNLTWMGNVFRLPAHTCRMPVKNGSGIASASSSITGCLSPVIEKAFRRSSAAISISIARHRRVIPLCCRASMHRTGILRVTSHFHMIAPSTTWMLKKEVKKT